MNRTDKLLHVATQLPGFFGYRPYFDGEETHVKELTFHLEDEIDGEKIRYIMVLFVEEEFCVDGLIDVRYNDGSIVTIEDEDEEFDEIIKHKRTVMNALNKM